VRVGLAANNNITHTYVYYIRLKGREKNPATLWLIAEMTVTTNTVMIVTDKVI